MTNTGVITGPAVIDIAILGELKLTIRGEPAAIPPKTARLLCELLTAGGHTVLADTLQRRLYSRELDHRTGQALRRCISDLRDILRGTIPPHDDRERVIFTRRIGAETGYGIHLNTVRLDATLFQHHAATASGLMRDGHWAQAITWLETARGLWRGNPFTGISDAASAGTWKTRLLTAHQTTIGEHAEALIRLDHVSEALQNLQAGAVTYPGNGRLWRLLMLALYVAERDSEASHASRDAIASFREEGIDPPAAVLQLQQDLLGHRLPREPGPALDAAGFARSALPAAAAS
jgi:DNA-binding SARP family transcriptional activator